MLPSATTLRCDWPGRSTAKSDIVGAARLIMRPWKRTSSPSRLIRNRLESKAADGSCHFGMRRVLRLAFVTTTSTRSWPRAWTLTRTGLAGSRCGAAVTEARVPAATAAMARPPPRRDLGEKRMCGSGVRARLAWVQMISATGGRRLCLPRKPCIKALSRNDLSRNDLSCNDLFCNGLSGATCPAMTCPGTTTARRGGPSRSSHVYGQFCDGVFSAKYSWLSALSRARVGSVSARFFAADWP